MKPQTLRSLLVVLLAVGVVLLVGGIVARTYGAAILGLVVAAVALQQWLKLNKRRAADDAKGQQGETGK